MEKTHAFTLRLDDETYQMLDHLVQVMGVSKQAYIITSIRTEYDKLQGNPELKRLLNQFADIQKQLQGFNPNK